MARMYCPVSDCRCATCLPNSFDKCVGGADVGQHLGIDPVGLGELAGGTGNISHLTGIEAGDRQPGGMQGGEHRRFRQPPPRPDDIT